VKEAIEQNLKKEISYLPYRRQEIEHAPEQKLDYADIGGLKDIVLYEPNWPNFEPFYGKREAFHSSGLLGVILASVPSAIKPEHKSYHCHRSYYGSNYFPHFSPAFIKFKHST